MKNKMLFSVILVMIINSLVVIAKDSSEPVRSDETTFLDSGYLAVNGVNYYYEILGTGEPLLFLHGGLFSVDMYRPVLQHIARTRKVIAVDQLGHGHTALGNRQIDYVAMADDMAQLVGKLGYKQLDVLGHSMGGGIAFRMAVQHPNLVKRAVLVSACYAQNGFYSDMLVQQAAVSSAMAGQLKDTPLYKSYITVAPKPEDFPKLLDQMGAWMRKPYDWSEDVKKLRMPIMLVFGDSDMFRMEHIVDFYHLLGGGLKDAGWMRENMSQNRLAILPNLTHYDLFFAPELVSTVLPFLDNKADGKSGIGK